MVSLKKALECVKGCVAAVLARPAVEAACARHGHHWHNGPLDPPHTVELMVRQVAEGNVSGAEVVRLAGGHFTESAWCQARQRLPLAVLQELAGQVRQRLTDAYRPEAPERAEPKESGEAKEAKEAGGSAGFTWRGHRVALVDASNFSMPDTPELRGHFGEVPGQKPGCGFPLAHWLAAFDLHTGLLLFHRASPYGTADLKHTPEAHQAVAALLGPQPRPGEREPGEREPEVIALGDDSFSGYGHLALLREAGMHAVVPAHHARRVDFTAGRPGGPDAPKGRPRSRWVRSLGRDDQVVELAKPQQRPKWLNKERYDALPEKMQVREIRRTVRRKGFRPRVITVVTTLLDAELYPADEVVALRERRWDVETDIRHLKTTMGMEVLKSQTVQGVLKELEVFGLLYNLVRGVMLESAIRQKKSPTRLSFADALAWVRHAEPGHAWPKLKVVKARPGRCEPRAVKRRPKPFDLMNRPRDEMRERAKQKQDAEQEKKTQKAKKTKEAKKTTNRKIVNTTTKAA